MEPSSSGTLYPVATPIGNLGDLSDRAKQVLTSVDLVACEDTRRTGKLLQELGLSKKLFSYHDHNEAHKAPQVLEQLLAGQNIALVSDAGTPCIHDPGFRLVRAAHGAGVRIVPVPGPSAVTTLLSAVGVGGSQFFFAGYLAKKSARLERDLTMWSSWGVPVVFFETGPRIRKTLKIFQKCIPDYKVFLGRELTKTFEEIRMVSLQDENIADTIKEKGEFVGLIEQG